MREVGELIADVHTASDQRSTFGRDSALFFATSADGAAFAEELTAAVDTLVAKYHGESTGGREHRLIIVVHPKGREVGNRRGIRACRRARAAFRCSRRQGPGT